MGLAYVAGTLLAAGHAVTVVDAFGEDPLRRGPSVHPRLATYGLSVEEIIDRIPPDTEGVGLSIMFSQQWPDTDVLIREISRARPDARIFVGGEHTTGCWEYILETCPPVDAVVIGEGEQSALEIAEWISGSRILRSVAGIACREDGVVVRTSARARIDDLSAIPRPAWELFPMEAYLAGGRGHGVPRGRAMPILATRGCPFRCTFCSSPDMWTTRYYVRDVNDVVDEVQDHVERYRAENIDFYDLTALLKRDWILELCAELERRGLNVTFQFPSGTRSEVLDPEVLAALARAGCRNICYAPESGSDRTLKLIKKKVKLDKILASMAAATRAGINVKANLVIGFPRETRADVYKTLAFGMKAAWAGVQDIPLYPFNPYPGTELYRELRERDEVPEPGNEYFARLTYMDLTRVWSVCREIGDVELNAYRTGGMMLAYGVGFMRRPQRLFRTLRNVLKGSGETVLEHRLIEMRRRASDASV